MDCIFCKIAKGEIPSYKVYEDENIFAFLDINPLVIGHTLIIPKKHTKWAWDLSDSDYLELMECAKTLAKSLRKTFSTEFVTESVIGADVSHAHVHLMPRRVGDGLGSFPHEKISPKPTDEEFRRIAENIKNNA